MKKKFTNLALIFGSAFIITSCGETKEALDKTADSAKDAAAKAIDDTKEVAKDTMTATKEAAAEMTKAVTPSGADSQEKLVDDAISLMKEGMGLMASGDKSAIAEMEKKGKALEERAKALGLDMNDPSSLPDELKEKIETATKELQKQMQEKMAEAMKKAMEDAGK